MRCHGNPFSRRGFLTAGTLGGLGISILSTPGGIVDDKTARKNKLGGEILCSVW